MPLPVLSTLREAIPGARAAHEQALREQQDTLRHLEKMQQELHAEEAINPDSQAVAQLRADVQALLDVDVPAAQNRVDAASAALEAARSGYHTAAAGEPPLWADDGSLPVLLLPVRLEAVYHNGGNGRELWVRVYPDDVHVDSHEPELTGAERAAGEAYWRAVWAAGTGDPAAPRRDQAWRTLTAAVGGARAPWAARLMRPAGNPPATETPADAAPPDPGPFPEPPMREHSWNRAPHTALLPDRFVVSAYRNGHLVWRCEGAQIPDVLPIGFAPPGTDATPAPDALPWDKASSWLVDFEAACTVGMGVKVPLPDDDPHYDVLTAVGVMRGIDAAEGARRVEQLFTAHRFTDGLSFLPVGTPTTNTPATRSAWQPSANPAPPDVEEDRRARFDASGTQATARLARALGIDGTLLAPLDGALDDEEDIVAAIQRLVGQMFGWSEDWAPPDTPPLFVTGTAPLVKHFSAHVRSRGPLPTVRVGRQPYGLLPASSLDLWRGSDVNPRIAAVLESFLTYVQQHASAAVQLGRGLDQDAVLLDILSRRAASTRIELIGAADDSGPPAASLVGAIPWSSRFARRGPGRRNLPTLEVTDPAPPELQTVVAQRPIQRCAALIAQITEFLNAWDWSTGEPSEEALAPVFGPLRELGAAMEPFRGVDGAGVFYPLLVPVADVALLCTLVLGFSAHRPDAEPQALAAARLAITNLVAVVQQAAEIEAQAVNGLGRIERLLCESLDTVSHRLDAWLTSLPTARLAGLRATAPAGLRLGAYGWLTDLAPADAAAQAALDGYLIAPSLQHATTAAVLRSGYLAHSDRSALAVNLTSRRVRRANALLDGVRSGQTLSALLGYQFERGLHDNHLEALIGDFRTRYPLAPLVQPDAEDAGRARTSIGARSVVDGEALRRDCLAFAGDNPPVAVAPADLPTVQRLLADLDDTVDALGDLLLAESVHHLVGGNPLRAGATVDALAGGSWLPPELDVVATPRSAALVRYAVGALAPEPTAATPSGWAGRRGVALLDPALERLAERWLGAAGDWAVDLTSDAGSLTLSPADVGLSALDVLLLAADFSTEAPDSVRASPLLRALLRHPRASGATLTAAGADRHRELAALAARWRTLLAGASPLLPSHLVPAADTDWAAVDLDELAPRVQTWADSVITGRKALRSARAAAAAAMHGADNQVLAVALRGLVTALDDLAAVGVRGAVCAGAPVDAAARDLLVAQADDILDRLTAMTPPPPVPAARTAASVQSWYAAAGTTVRSVIGDAMVLLPRIDLGPVADAMEPAHRPLSTSDDEVADWLRDVGQVRPATDGFRHALLAGELLAGGSPETFVVTQSPCRTGQPWVATARSEAARSRGPGGSTCVLAGELAATTVAGLVVDAWTEALPRHPHNGQSPEEIAGIACHVNRPDARAPQAALLAVPPDVDRGWREEDLHAVVLDCLDLAALRTLDLTDLPELRAILPPTAPAT
ncbi:hypothetical protein GA0074695_2930 [Micromonospora viridifaciens]|uniref:Uncharacterized protein n=1 Tax=Micromonospora viridifaciens TaxID=1881 RepID=A0A1C4X1T6_MICVI|nr:hypothetical protein [Micromonospora viridifaciens]SCF02364.1 hypothetical protein GA0074695_2930 [Micromonospora viridifaciens]